MDETKVKAKDKPHYVNNRQFSNAVMDHVNSVNAAREVGEPSPVVSDYIASCFLKIAERVSHKPNFIQYTYRDDMVMDAVENCLVSIKNYNIEAATKTGRPNAFGYFTRVSINAFMRRIIKEKKQQNIKRKWIDEAGIDEMVDLGEGEGDVPGIEEMRRQSQDAFRREDTGGEGRKEGILEENEPKGVEIFMER